MNFSGGPALAMAPLVAGLAIFGFLILILFARLLLVGEPGLALADIEVALGAATTVMAAMAVGNWWLMRRVARGRRARWEGRSESLGSADRSADRFDDGARRALTLAQDEAQRLGHHYIGTEHLLLGLVRENQSAAARALGNMNVELETVRTVVESIIGRGGQVGPEVGLTPRAKRVIELTIEEARRLGHHRIGTEHLLLGILREGEGIAAGVLLSLGVGLDRARIEVMAELSRQA
jgi:hypothetical protein